MATSWAILSRDSGFSKTEMSLFREDIRCRILKPGNHTGFEGPGVRWSSTGQREKWLQWLNNFLDSGIGTHYWGPGTSSKWNFATNRDQIRNFLRDAVQYMVGQIKSREKGRQNKENQLLEKQPLVGLKIPPEGSTKKNLLESTISSKQESRQIVRSLKRKRLSGRIPKSGTGYRIAPVIFDISSGDEEPSGSNKTRPPTLQTLIAPTIVENQKLKFVLEATMNVSSSTKLIHGADVPSLAHLVEKLYKKYGLSPEQEIREIKVKFLNKTFNVDLDECRDWRYISREIDKSCTWAELFFLAS